ncbi:hypothetical protein FOMPIDRAFT_1056759, partial [Fomitopsis schrenkii]
SGYGDSIEDSEHDHGIKVATPSSVSIDGRDPVVNLVFTQLFGSRFPHKVDVFSDWFEDELFPWVAGTTGTEPSIRIIHLPREAWADVQQYIDRIGGRSFCFVLRFLYNSKLETLIMSVTKKTHVVVPGAVFDFVKGIAIPEQHLPYTSLSYDTSAVALYAVVGEEDKPKIIMQVPDCKVTSVLRAELQSLDNLKLLAPRTAFGLRLDEDEEGEGEGEGEGGHEDEGEGEGEHEHEGEEDAGDDNNDNNDDDDDDDEVVGYHAEFAAELYNLETADSKTFEHALRKVCVSVTLKGTYAATTTLACNRLYYGDRTLEPRSTIIFISDTLSDLTELSSDDISLPTAQPPTPATEQASSSTSVAPAVPAPSVPTPAVSTPAIPTPAVSTPAATATKAVEDPTLQKDRPLRRSTKRVGEEDEILACLPVILVNIAKVNSGQAQRKPRPEGYLCHVIASTDGRIILHEASMAQDSFIGDLWHKGKWMAPERKASIMVFPDDEGLEMLRLGAKEGWSEDVFIAKGYGMHVVPLLHHKAQNDESLLQEYTAFKKVWSRFVDRFRRLQCAYDRMAVDTVYGEDSEEAQQYDTRYHPELRKLVNKLPDPSGQGDAGL